MGIFDGILICSDIDGTFEKPKDHPMPNANIEAVNYFKQNGGHFTFCTGRLADHLKERGLSQLTNAPACLCNGAIIYDFEKDCIIDSSLLCHSTGEIIEAMHDFKDIATKMHIAIGNEYFIVDTPLPESLNIHPNKMVWVFDEVSEADRFLNTARERFDCYDLSKSWPFGVEFVDKNHTKGNALDYIKKYTGAHTSVGIGDFGNDITLIQHADIGVAVGNAVDELKEHADMVVCEYKKNAIADLIYKLEEKIKNA